MRVKYELVLLGIWFEDGKNGESPPWSTWEFMQMTHQENGGGEGSSRLADSGIEIVPGSRGLSATGK